jgi:hypothetical protein
MKKQADFFIDFNSGAVGSFVKTTPVVGEQDLVDVWYVPLGFKIKPRKIRSIPRKALISCQIGGELDGCQNSYTVILENAKGEAELLEAIGLKFGAKISEISEELNEERYKSRTAQHKAKESEESLDKQKKKEIERSRSGGGGIGGVYGRPPFGGDRYRDELFNL